MEEKRGQKRPLNSCNYDDNGGDDRVYRFQVLLPNGAFLEVSFRNPAEEIPLMEFVDKVKQKHMQAMEEVKTEHMKPRRKIFWKNGDLCLEDGLGNKIKGKFCFLKFRPHITHILRLNDGSSEIADTFEHMWDLTPDTDLLMELPQEYTFETALADLIDNSLQALWSNAKDERRLICVEIAKDKISVFDTGPGMDGGDENSITKWGKMGASLHRSFKALAIGVKPPYLKPFFGMFGYGGPIASMHLGRRATVCAKTKESKNVCLLELERKGLLKHSGSGSKLTWKTGGSFKKPADYKNEIQKSPHGSFTKVTVYEPKFKVDDIFQLQCKLKDIYFPYIQSDEISTGKTTTLVSFQVNGISLTEIDGGEVATTNLHSCNGPEFVVQLSFSVTEDNGMLKSPCIKGSREANARLKCVYLPVREGKESIDSILEKLKSDGYEITEDFASFSHVSVRRLGRLLPDARWAWLPFMEPRQKRGDTAQILKRCCRRVKCFIDADAGFYPTMSKTDLAHHHPFTKALKNLGAHSVEKETGVEIKTYREGKSLTLSQLEKEYQDWIFQMHSQYDEEFDCGDDQPVFLVSPQNKDELGISSDVVRVHQIFTRRGKCWKSGQRIKILKGAGPRFHKSSMYVTLEYFLLEGLQGDAGGEARIVCRPLGVQDQDGCVLKVDDMNLSLELRSSFALPVNIFDSGKCLVVDDPQWNSQVEKYNKRMPSTIEILSLKQCQELGVNEALPSEAAIFSGHVPPLEVFAIVRPDSYVCGETDSLDQKNIIRDNFDMCMDIDFKDDGGKITGAEHIFSVSVRNTSLKGCSGLYAFPIRSKFPDLFGRAGVYTFSFSLKQSVSISYERSIHVKALSKVGQDKLLKQDQDVSFNVRRAPKNLPPRREPLPHAVLPRERKSFSSTATPTEMALSVFNKVSQVEKRELKLSSKVPEVCSVGSKLRDVMFEVVNCNGEIDKTVHDEGKHSHCHTLTVKAEFLGTRNPLQYSFQHGQCIIPAITLPQKVGSYWLLAAHSRYPKLSLRFKVTVVQIPEKEDGSVISLSQKPEENHDDIASQSSNGESIHLRDSVTLEHIDGLGPILDNSKDLESDVHGCDFLPNCGERGPKWFSLQKNVIIRDISLLQDYSSQKELMMDNVESKTETAAAVYCSLLRKLPSEEWQQKFKVNIVGLVALLATVSDSNLSRMLAQFLGEDHMLAIVCQANAASGMLDKYEHVLNSLQTRSGKTIRGRHLFICLEDVRPYTGDLDENDPQRRLAMTTPILPTGETPPGFLGYAVNLIDIDIENLHTRTVAGHGLRQTLFYRLFGMLQVYETKEFMKQAYGCIIKDGAISLDGAIMRGDGILEVGHREPDIHFPVIAPEIQMNASQLGGNINDQIEEQKARLKVVDDVITSLNKKGAKYLRKCDKKRITYLKYCDDVEASRRTPSQTNPSTASPSTSSSHTRKFMSGHYTSKRHG
ncbi:hypothetical protein Ancab_009967 [Ancistrocladus abbreviatus]